MWVTTRASLFSLSHFFGHLSQPTNNPKPQWNTKHDLTLCKRQVAEILSYFSCIPIVLISFVLSFFRPLSDGHRTLFNGKSHVSGGMPPSLRQGLRPWPARVAGGVWPGLASMLPVEGWRFSRIRSECLGSTMDHLYHQKVKVGSKGSLPTLKWNNPGYPGILYGGWWTQVKHWSSKWKCLAGWWFKYF